MDGWRNNNISFSFLAMLANCPLDMLDENPDQTCRESTGASLEKFSKQHVMDGPSYVLYPYNIKILSKLTNPIERKRFHLCRPFPIFTRTGAYELSRS
jgi:hypothetical protein